MRVVCVSWLVVLAVIFTQLSLIYLRLILYMDGWTGSMASFDRETNKYIVVLHLLESSVNREISRIGIDG